VEPAYTRPVAAHRPIPWVVLCETERRRWGGDLRRARIFHELAGRTGGTEAQGWNHTAVEAAVRRVAGPPFPWRRRPALASAEFLSEGGVARARRACRSVVLDVHDHPLAQAEALGVALDPATRRVLVDRLSRNIDLFPLHVAPSASFAELAGLDSSRTIVAPNGSDTTHVAPRPFPAEPAVGMVSGAAPGRGIEALVDAARALRRSVPDLRLYLWLATADEASEAYAASVRAATADEPWVAVAATDYDALPGEIARATVLVVPHPPGPYMDVAVPVKLLDSMAAGRPVVVTPRTEMRAIVEAAGAGRVAGGDGPDELAGAILPLLEDAALAARLGAAGRSAAEHVYDWAVIGRTVAGEVLARSAALGIAT